LAMLTLNSLANGNHIVTAAYGGSAAFAASTSARSSLMVTGPVVPADGPLVTSFQRFGYHSQPTVLIVTFNEQLDPAGADNAVNYRIASIGPGGTLGQAVAIKRIAYDSATMTVTIHPSHRLNVHNRFELIVDGTTTHAVTDLALDALDGRKTGTAGSNYVGMVDWASLAGPSLSGKKYVNFWMKLLRTH
jgi:large repetitive protein